VLGFSWRILRKPILGHLSNVGLTKRRKRTNCKKDSDTIHANLQYGKLVIINNAILLNIYMKCPCCGSEMQKAKDLENSILMKCSGCGLSDTVVKS
jgi:hypothetical protein